MKNRDKQREALGALRDVMVKHNIGICAGNLSEKCELIGYGENTVIKIKNELIASMVDDLLEQETE